MTRPPSPLIRPPRTATAPDYSSSAHLFDVQGMDCAPMCPDPGEGGEVRVTEWEPARWTSPLPGLKSSGRGGGVEKVMLVGPRPWGSRPPPTEGQMDAAAHSPHRGADELFASLFTPGSYPDPSAPLWGGSLISAGAHLPQDPPSGLANWIEYRRSWRRGCRGGRSSGRAWRGASYNRG